MDVFVLLFNIACLFLGVLLILTFHFTLQKPSRRLVVTEGISPTLAKNVPSGWLAMGCQSYLPAFAGLVSFFFCYQYICVLKWDDQPMRFSVGIPFDIQRGDLVVAL